MKYQNKKPTETQTQRSSDQQSLVDNEYVDETIATYIEFVNELMEYLNSEKDDKLLLHSLKNFAAVRASEKQHSTKKNKLRNSFLNKLISLMDIEHELLYKQIKHPKLFFIICFLLEDELFTKKDHPDSITNMMDQQFIMLADKVIGENLANPNFNTIIWSKELGIGRTLLFKKIKQITGITPNDYIMRMKMKKSLALLANHSLTLTTISWQLGFCNPAYFSRCFKKQFGMSPAKFRKTR